MDDGIDAVALVEVGATGERENPRPRGPLPTAYDLISCP
jgi:hypothetical protein